MEVVVLEGARRREKCVKSALSLSSRHTRERERERERERAGERESEVGLLLPVFLGPPASPPL
jgi:hypothetical protein